MRLDKFSNPIFNESDLFQLVYSNNEIGYDLIKSMIFDSSKDIELFEKFTNIEINRSNQNLNEDLDSFDKNNQANWFLPDDYLNFNIKQFCLEKCHTETQQNRVIDEFTEFEHRGMILLLKWLKFFVDTCKDKNILWGVGRGSSVASYILFLLEVHAIDSIKYNLDWRDFLR